MSTPIGIAATLAPVLKAARSVTISTAPIEQLIRVVSHWLTAGLLGGMVIGRPRLGKTFGVRSLLRRLNKLMGVAWCEIPARKSLISTESAFFSYVLTRHKHSFVRGTSAAKGDRLIELFLARASQSPLNASILFFDEAQYLTQNHYEYLVGLSNEVEAEGARLFCLLVGQQALANRRGEFLASGAEEIVGRFMVEVHQFTGLTSEPALRCCLAGYDTQILSSPLSEQFVRLLAPCAWEKGFRLEQVSQKMWKAFVAAAHPIGGLPEYGVTMHYVHSVVINLLSAVNDLGPDDPKDEAIATAVARSYYYGALQSLQRPPQQEKGRR